MKFGGTFNEANHSCFLINARIDNRLGGGQIWKLFKFNIYTCTYIRTLRRMALWVTLSFLMNLNNFCGQSTCLETNSGSADQEIPLLL